MDTSNLSWIEGVGYLAALLVFSTFYMKTMIPLRSIAVCSNVTFLVYGYLAGLYPVVFLHAVLLPLNLIRLYQMHALIESVRRASEEDRSLEWLTPFMTRQRFKREDILFRKGDPADKLYYIINGSVRVPEKDVIIGSGEILGEIGIFAPSKERTASTVCEADATVLVLSDQKVLELYYQNPEFGLYLLRLIIRRLLDLKETNLRGTLRA